MLIQGQERIAEVFGVAPKTIVEWQEQGFPVAKRGGPGVASEYDSSACITWYVNREIEKASGESAKDRLNRLQGDKIQRELAVMDRELIPAAEIEPGMSRFFVDLLSELDQVPETYCDAIAAMAGDSLAVHQALTEIVTRTKDFCATYRFDPAAVGAAAGADRKDAARGL
jgi:hypothetical protein